MEKRDEGFSSGTASAPSIDEKRKQLVDQCRCVIHLAQTLADVHRDLIKVYQVSAWSPVDIAGQRTASIMEDLGNILNNMDAVEESDDWMKPIFRAAHAIFPS